MNLTDINTIKSILADNHLWAKKRLGQNFLVASQPLITLTQTANITDDDTIVEIGPGLGTLTQELGKKAKLVLAIEKDYKLVEWLRKKFKNQSSKIKIIHQDILRLAICGPPASRVRASKSRTGEAGLRLANYKLVSNLPYNITSPVIRKFLEADNPPSEMVLTVQKEVAERICAKPGDSDRGILTVMVEFYAQAEIIEIVHRSCFWPIPKVDSAIIKITLKPFDSVQGKQINKATIETRLFFRTVKAGFSQKRKQIHNSLFAVLYLSNMDILDILKTANINPQLRAEDLNLADWMNLCRSIQNASKKRNIRTNG